MARVHLTRCNDYNPAGVQSAVREALAAVIPPGLLRPGLQVLLKPNVINDMTPDRAVCTHPQVVRAVAEYVLEAGASVIIADQPGYALAQEAARAFNNTGMVEACAGLDVQFELLAQGGYTDIALANPWRLKTVQYATRAHTADLVINLPKAKTHSQTLYTGALKNMFGAMAPRQRLEVHLLGGYWALSEALVDCYAARVPEVHLMDAVVVMEGMGPTQGRPRDLGAIAASTDGVALDLITAGLMGFADDEIATTVVAGNSGIGERLRDNIEVTGLAPAEVTRRVARAPIVRPDMLGRLMPLLRPLITARPSVDRRKCRQCQACAGICPRKAIVIEDYARVDCKLCVECFCCLEACPYDAIGLKRSPFYTLAWWVKKLLDKILTRKQ
ncbi:MAG: DUF362 domain-containing protein [Armatimonadia bacterium]